MCFHVLWRVLYLLGRAKHGLFPGVTTMAKDKIERASYDPEYDDPKLIPPSEKSWLNARTELVRTVIRSMRRRGIVIPSHNCEFVIGCAAPFRYAASVTPTEVEAVITEMIKLYVKLGHFTQYEVAKAS